MNKLIFRQSIILMLLISSIFIVSCKKSATLAEANKSFRVTAESDIIKALKGVSSDTKITLINDYPTTLDNISIQILDDAGGTLTASSTECSSKSLNPKASCDFVLQLYSATIGDFTGKVKVMAGGPNAKYDIDKYQRTLDLKIRFLENAPILNITEVKKYPVFPVGITTEDGYKVILKNNGSITTGNLEIVFGTDKTKTVFQVKRDTCSAKELMPNTTCEIVYNIVDPKLGSSDTTLTITDNKDIDSKRNLIIEASADPIIEVTHNIPDTLQGKKSATYKITINNITKVPINDLVISGLTADGFSITDKTSCEKVPALGSCFIDIAFALPSEYRLYQDNLSLTYDKKTEITNIEIKVTPDVGIKPTKGSATVSIPNSWSETYTITSGAVPLNIAKIVAPTDFTITGTCAFTGGQLPSANQSCTVVLGYSAKAKPVTQIKGSFDMVIDNYKFTYPYQFDVTAGGIAPSTGTSFALTPIFADNKAYITTVAFGITNNSGKEITSGDIVLSDSSHFTLSGLPIPNSGDTVQVMMTANWNANKGSPDIAKKLGTDITIDNGVKAIITKAELGEITIKPNKIKFDPSSAVTTEVTSDTGGGASQTFNVMADSLDDVTNIQTIEIIDPNGIVEIGTVAVAGKIVVVPNKLTATFNGTQNCLLPTLPTPFNKDTTSAKNVHCVMSLSFIGEQAITNKTFQIKLVPASTTSTVGFDEFISQVITVNKK